MQNKWQWIFLLVLGGGSEVVLEMVLKLTQMCMQDNQQQQKTSEFDMHCSK